MRQPRRAGWQSRRSAVGGAGSRTRWPLPGGSARRRGGSPRGRRRAPPPAGAAQQGGGEGLQRGREEQRQWRHARRTTYQEAGPSRGVGKQAARGVMGAVAAPVTGGAAGGRTRRAACPAGAPGRPAPRRGGAARAGGEQRHAGGPPPRAAAATTRQPQRKDAEEVGTHRERKATRGGQQQAEGATVRRETAHPEVAQHEGQHNFCHRQIVPQVRVARHHLQ